MVTRYYQSPKNARKAVAKRTGDYRRRPKHVDASDPRLFKCTGLCGRYFTRRDLGICYGGLRCQGCWPDDVDGRVSADGNSGGGCEDVEYSQLGFPMLVVHKSEIEQKVMGKRSKQNAY